MLVLEAIHPDSNFADLYSKYYQKAAKKKVI